MVGFLGLLDAAAAETPPSSTSGAAFDGTYNFVSSTKLAETYIATGTSRMAQCPDRIAGPRTIVNAVYHRHPRETGGFRRNSWVSERADDEICPPQYWRAADRENATRHGRRYRHSTRGAERC
jgi:hypothetical protein